MIEAYVNDSEVDIVVLYYSVVDTSREWTMS